MNPQRFEATLTQRGTKTLIVLPFDPNEAWGAKEKHYISGTVAEHRIRGVLDCIGAEYVLPLGDAWRRDNGLEAGAVVEVVLAPEGPQADNMAPDILAALAAEPEAKAFFESLATFYRKNYVRWIESAKRPATRPARIAEMVRLLKAGQRQKG